MNENHITEKEWLGEKPIVEIEKFPFSFARLPAGTKINRISRERVEVIVQSKINKK